MNLQKLEFLLSENKDKWIRGSDIAAKLNTGTLQIRSLIIKLRRSGLPIIASNKGYCYTTNLTELKLYCFKRELDISREKKTIDLLLNTNLLGRNE